MYYEDMTPYEYSSPPLDNVFNIGWLDRDYPFPTGTIEPDFLDKLATLIISTPKVNVMRGTHGCGFGDVDHLYEDFFLYGQKRHILGHAELFIPGENGCYFAVPTLVYHYIEAHFYLPPQEFMDAVMNFNPPPDWNPEGILKELINVAMDSRKSSDESAE